MIRLNRKTSKVRFSQQMCGKNEQICNKSARTAKSLGPSPSTKVLIRLNNTLSDVVLRSKTKRNDLTNIGRDAHSIYIYIKMKAGNY